MMHANSEIEMRVQDSITQVEHSAWERIRNQDNLLTDPQYLKAVEESQALECEFRYFEFYANGELICGLSGYWLETDLAAYSGEWLAKMLEPIRRIFPRLLKVKTLIIGSPVSMGLTAVVLQTIQIEQLKTIFERVIDYACEKKIQLVLIRDFKGERSLLEQALKDTSFEQITNFPLAYMAVPWKSFDEYLAAMKKHYRYNTRQRMKDKEAQGIRTRIINDVSALKYNKSYVALYQQVLERSNEFPHEFIGEAYHQSMWDNLGPHSYWLQYFQEDDLVAFLHFIQYKKRIIAQYIGMDYQVSKDAQLYFNAVYDLIRFAIENKAELIDVGVTTYQAKSSMGFSVIPGRMYLWQRSKLVRKLAGWVSHTFSNFDLEDCYHIFKDPQLQIIINDKD